MPPETPFFVLGEPRDALLQPPAQEVPLALPREDRRLIRGLCTQEGPQSAQVRRSTCPSFVSAASSAGGRWASSPTPSWGQRGASPPEYYEQVGLWGIRTVFIPIYFILWRIFDDFIFYTFSSGRLRQAGKGVGQVEQLEQLQEDLWHIMKIVQKSHFNLLLWQYCYAARHRLLVEYYSSR